MGVKDLWTIVSPTSNLIKLEDLKEKFIAIDLSCWICDSQKANIGHSVVEPYLRNLFFRTVSLLKSNIIPVFVIEGKAPELKLSTIESRLSKENFKGSGSQNRRRLKGHLNKCIKLFKIMGLPYIQAEGEAEASCAALSYHNLVDAIITQDSDVFLYGGKIVLRNFTGNQLKATVERYNIDSICNLLELNRESMICLALLLGCDYIPGGVPGVGKENALKLIHTWKSQGISSSIERLKNWSASENELKSNHKTKKRQLSVEELVQEKAMKTAGFPFPEVIEEFTKVLKKPRVKMNWEMPQTPELVHWCSDVLGWPNEYALSKVLPLASQWILSYSIPKSVTCLTPVEIVRKRVKKRIPSYEVKWIISRECLDLLYDGAESEVVMVESSHLMQKTFGSLVESFEESLSSKGKKKKPVKNAKLKEAKKVSSKAKKFPVNQKTVNDEEICNIDSSLNDNSSVVFDESIDEAELSRIINGFVGLNMSSPKRTTTIRTPKQSEKVILNQESDDKKSEIKDHEVKKDFTTFSESQLNRDEFVTNEPLISRLNLDYSVIDISSDSDCEIHSRNEVFKGYEQECLIDKSESLGAMNSPCVRTISDSYELNEQSISFNGSADLFDESSVLEESLPRKIVLSEAYLSKEFMPEVTNYKKTLKTLPSPSPCFQLIDSLADLSLGTSPVPASPFGKKDLHDNSIKKNLAIRLFSEGSSVTKNILNSEEESHSKIFLETHGNNATRSPNIINKDSQNLKIDVKIPESGFDSPIIETLTLAERLKKKFNGKLDHVINDL